MHSLTQCNWYWGSKAVATNPLLRYPFYYIFVLMPFLPRFLRKIGNNDTQQRNKSELTIWIDATLCCAVLCVLLNCVNSSEHNEFSNFDPLILIRLSRGHPHKCKPILNVAFRLLMQNITNVNPFFLFLLSFQKESRHKKMKYPARELIYVFKSITTFISTECHSSTKR